MLQRLLIDGYNLLHASDVFVAPGEAATLERTRQAFLQFLADQLPERQRRRTTIVFDAAQAPAGLPRQLSFAGMNVLFSRRPQHADDLLEEILASAKGTRELLVVSSDHRVQRAARQRGANYLDSEKWIQELRQESVVAAKSDLELSKPMADDIESSPELQQWLEVFNQQPPAPPVKNKPTSPLPPPTPPKAMREIQASENKDRSEPAWNPFPPGYAEDLLSEE
jgi:predicted RNA-binding protein with PIN domain